MCVSGYYAERIREEPEADGNDSRGCRSKERKCGEAFTTRGEGEKCGLRAVSGGGAWEEFRL